MIDNQGSGVTARVRDLLVTLVERQFRLWSKRSTLALVWPIAAPYLLAALYLFVFRGVFDIPVDRYFDFLLCGLLPWSYLVFTINRSIGCISAEPELVRKVTPHCELLPLSVVIAGTATFVATLIIFIGTLAVRGELALAPLLALPLPILATVLLVGSLALAIALVDVYNHDLQIVLGNVLTVWFFLLPIVYRNQMAPTSIGFLQSIDPMNLIVGQMRDLLYYGRIDHPEKLVSMVVLTACLFAASLLVFRRLAVSLPKDV